MYASVTAFDTSLGDVMESEQAAIDKAALIASENEKIRCFIDTREIAIDVPRFSYENGRVLECENVFLALRIRKFV